MLFDSRGTRNREGHGRQKYISSTSATVCRNFQVAIFIYGASRPMRSRRGALRTLFFSKAARGGGVVRSPAPSPSPFPPGKLPGKIPPSRGITGEFPFFNFRHPTFS